MNSILYGSCTINTNVIQTLRKVGLVFMIVSLLQDFAVGVKGVTCVLNCLLHICKEDVSLFYFQILSWFGCSELCCKIFWLFD